MRVRALVVFLVVLGIPQLQLNAQSSFAYVANASGAGISVYSIDNSTGALSQIPGSPFPDNPCAGQLGSCPVWVAADPSNKFLYAAEAGVRSISVFSINASDGGSLMPVLGGTILVGDVIQSITLHPSGKFAYAASVSANHIFGFAVDPASGKLTSLPWSPLSTSPAVPIYTINFDPTGRFLYAGTNNQLLFGYTVDGVTGALTPIPGSPFSGGMRAAITPNGAFLYTGGETTVGTGYRIDSITGALRPLANSTFNVGRGAVVDPTGRFLYTAYGSVWGYAIDANTGSLSVIPGLPIEAAISPGWTALDPSGRFLYVVNTDAHSANISAYSIDATAGSLTPILGSPFPNGRGPQGITTLALTSLAVGTINVSTNLSAATFTITGPATFNGSGAVSSFNNAPAGTYTITYGAVAGYMPVPSSSLTLSAGGSINFIGIYVPSALSVGSGGTTGPFGTVAEPVNTSSGNYYTSHTDLRVDGKGLSFAFTRYYNSLDTYRGPVGAGWTHSFNISLRQASGKVVVKEADGHEDIFNPTGGGSYAAQTAGLFDSLKMNPDGSFTLTRKNQIQLNFSSTGKLLTIVDRNGNTQALTYSGANLTSITDSSGRVFTLSYDGSNRLVALSDPLGRVFHYGYDSNGNLTLFQDALGGTTQYTYDGHRMTTATDARGVVYLQNTYDAEGRVVLQKNARVFATTFAYDTPTAGTTSITDPLGNPTKHTHDNSLRLISVQDALGGTVNYTYDQNNNRSSVRDQLSRTTSFFHDATGNVTRIVDALGSTTTFTYDARNDLTSATNAKGKTTRFTYDSKGNLATVQDAAGNTTVFSYDTAGELVRRTDARGNRTTYTYDAAGHLINVTDALGKITRFAYDAVSRLTSLTDANGHVVSSLYDALDRLVKVSDPLGNATQFGFDSVGSLLKITDANGNATSYTYDATNNLSAVTDALNNITRYAYDANNNRIGFTNAKNNITSYRFDGLNRVIQSSDPLLNLTSRFYDSAGNVISVTDANGKTNHFTYDALNRLVTINYSDGSVVAYSYDADGNRTSMVDPHGTTTSTYDDLDRLITVNNPGGKVVRYSHDTVGKRSTLTYPDGKVVHYSHDALNRLSRVTDWLSRNIDYDYDAAGNLIGTAYPNRTRESLRYDAADRLVEIVNAFRDDDPLRIMYTMDKVGNRLTQATTGQGLRKFSYDALNRLVRYETGTDKDKDQNDDKPGHDLSNVFNEDSDVDSKGAIAWTYDPVGNRLKEITSKETTNYTYDAADRLLSAGATTFSYDGNGNQLTKKTPRGTVNYTYDAANRLIQASGLGVNSVFAYDGDAQRISQATSKGTYRYVNDIATALPVVLNEDGPDGEISYVYGLGLIEELSHSFNFFYHFDGLGSIVALSDAEGRQRVDYAYDAWGNSLRTKPDSIGTKNKYRFTGEALDPETGLYYLRARYYNPTIGRFINKDPLAGIITHPQSMSRYAYALSNPLRFSDPSGLTSIENNQEGQVLGAFISAVHVSPRGPGPLGQIPVTIPPIPMTSLSTPSSLLTGPQDRIDILKVYADKLAPEVLIALSRGGPVTPAILEEMVKSIGADAAAALLDKLGYKQAAQDVRDFNTCLTPFLGDLGGCDQRLGEQAGNLTHKTSEWILNQLSRFFKLRLPSIN